MSEKPTTVFILDPDKPPQMSEEDRAHVEAVTDRDAYAKAQTDPDNPPVESGSLRRVPNVRDLRESLGLSVAEFAARYSIPTERVQAWEDRRIFPDQTARAYLRVIAAMPADVQEALAVI